MNKILLNRQTAAAALRSRYFVIAAAACALAAVSAVSLNPGNAVLAEQAPSVDARLGSLPDMSLGFANLVEAVSPAVVAINTRVQAVSDSVPQERNRREWNFRNNPFQEFWNGPIPDWFKQMPDMHRFQNPDRRPRAGLGSGVIFDPRGYIATNAHVVDDADLIEITMADGATHEAKVIGIDKFTDLAVIKIDSGESFPYARFGDSESVRVGDLAIALGNPFGFQHSVSLGIVSAKHRDNVMSESNIPLIQTDAAINRGNSGGPLFNVRGEIIGINTLIYSPSGSNSGVGFAIPALLVEQVADGLITDGSIQRGRLGVLIQNLTEEMAEALGTDSVEGALVASVDESSAADLAGVEVGDVIVSFNGQPVSDVKQLAQRVRETKPKSNVGLEVLRDGELISLEATLGGLQTGQLASADASSQPEQDSQPKIGVQLATLDEQTRQQFRIHDKLDGVVVVDVQPGSPAEDAGLRPGDVIISVSKQDVSTPDEVVDSIRQAADGDKSHLLMLIGRDGNQRFHTVELS